MPSPLELYAATVPPEWIDYNGHMNVAAYVAAFDQASDAVLEHLGLGSAYRAASGCSLFVVESHVNYLHELVEGTPIRVDAQLLGHDSKRLHLFQRMYHAEAGFLAASIELLLVHVSLGERRAVALPIDALERLNALMREHLLLPHPLAAGRGIGLRAKPPQP